MLTDVYIIPEDEELKRIEFSMTYLDNYLDEWYNKKRSLVNDEITQEEYYELKKISQTAKNILRVKEVNND